MPAGLQLRHKPRRSGLLYVLARILGSIVSIIAALRRRVVGSFLARLGFAILLAAGGQGILQTQRGS